jgi:sortase A
MMRRAARTLGTLLVAAGVAVLAWVLVVWLWQDPFTSLYTRYQQRELASSYEKVEARYRPLPLPPSTSPAAERRAIALEAGKYRRRLPRGGPVGRLRIPRLDLNMIVVNGTDEESLKRGPGRDLRSFMPGQRELVYVAGHRTTYSAPFARIDSMRRGDLVTFEVPYATIVYRVTGHVIVPATDLARLDSRGREELALQACHPRFFASDRYIVYARPVRLVPQGRAESTLARGGAQRQPASREAQPRAK